MKMTSPPMARRACAVFVEVDDAASVNAMRDAIVASARVISDCYLEKTATKYMIGNLV